MYFLFSLKIEESLVSAGKSREAKLTKIQEKQKIREDRARRAREKVSYICFHVYSNKLNKMKLGSQG